jgi:hypothetical protein
MAALALESAAAIWPSLFSTGDVSLLRLNAVLEGRGPSQRDKTDEALTPFVASERTAS